MADTININIYDNTAEQTDADAAVEKAKKNKGTRLFNEVASDLDKKGKAQKKKSIEDNNLMANNKLTKETSDKSTDKAADDAKKARNLATAVAISQSVDKAVLTGLNVYNTYEGLVIGDLQAGGNSVAANNKSRTTDIATDAIGFGVSAVANIGMIFIPGARAVGITGLITNVLQGLSRIGLLVGKNYEKIREDTQKMNEYEKQRSRIGHVALNRGR